MRQAGRQSRQYRKAEQGGLTFHRCTASRQSSSCRTPTMIIAPCTLALMRLKTPVRQSSTTMRVNPVTALPRGVWQPTLLDTADREKDPVCKQGGAEGAVSAAIGQ